MADNLVLRIVHDPAGGLRQTFEFDADNPLSLEAEALESAGGEAWSDYTDWLQRIGNGNVRARRALLWVLLRRNDPAIRFADVVFNLAEFQVEDVVEPEPEGKGEPGDGSTDSSSLEPVSEPSPSS